MCYSAMVEQKLKSIGLRFKARIQTELFEDLFRRCVFRRFLPPIPV